MRPLVARAARTPALALALAGALVTAPAHRAVAQQAPGANNANNASNASNAGNASGANNAPPPAPQTPSLDGTLREDSVLSSVDRAFPLLRAAERDLEAAEGNVLSAEGGFDVQLRARAGSALTGQYTNATFDAVFEQPTALWGSSFFAGYRVGQGIPALGGVGYNEGFAAYDGKLLTNEYGELRAGLSVPLWRNGPIDLRRAAVGRAQAARRVAERSLAQARIDYRRAAALRYWDWVNAGARLRVAEALLALALQRNAGIAARVDRGDLPNLERVDNDRVVQSRRAALALAQRALEATAIELSLYLRDEAGRPMLVPPTRLPPELPVPDPGPDGSEASLVREALARRPDLGRLAAQREGAEIERDYARNQMAPGINVTVAVSQDIGQQNPMLARPEVIAGITLDYPLQNRAAVGRSRAADAALSRVDEQARFQRERIEADVRDALSALRAARARWEASRQELTLAREVEQGERQRFDNGDSTILQVNLREVATAEASLRELDARGDYRRATVALRAATATLGGPGNDG